MKGLSTFGQFERVEMSREEFRKSLRDAITMMIEYRDIHGRDETAAMEEAVNECMEGMDAAWELKMMGEEVMGDLEFIDPEKLNQAEVDALREKYSGGCLSTEAKVANSLKAGDRKTSFVKALND